jgi:hypothetical protein
MKMENPAVRVPFRLAVGAAVLLLTAHHIGQSAPPDAGAAGVAGKEDDKKPKPVPQPSWSFISSVKDQLGCGTGLG